jgi:hypothetical protein
MKTTFLDTSYLLALVLEDDAHHHRALELKRGLSGHLLTTEHVLLEFMDALSGESLRPRALQTVGLLRGSRAVRVVAGTASLFEEGLADFARYDDKEWTLTDCISFIVMRREGVTEALTTDHHFEQAGFRALLRSPKVR